MCRSTAGRTTPAKTRFPIHEVDHSDRRTRAWCHRGSQHVAVIREILECSHLASNCDTDPTSFSENDESGRPHLLRIDAHCPLAELNLMGVDVASGLDCETSTVAVAETP